jgi:hypothetical protein
MPPAISVVVSTLALTTSMVTAWLALFRRGTVPMISDEEMGNGMPRIDNFD